MKRNKIIAIIAALLITTGAIAWWQLSAHHTHEEGDGHNHADEPKEHKENDGHGYAHEDEGQHEEGAVISEAAQKNAGIVVEKVSSAKVSKTVALTGSIILNQNKTALIKARFPGVIRSMKKEQGETVTADETLATVESNESLQVYPVKSPLAGTVLVKNGNVGDVAGEEPIYTISDISELWVELHVFTQDAGKIKAGQEITISSSECDDVQKTTITSLLPVTDSSSQTLLARAVVKNLDSHWLPGMSVRGDAVTSDIDAELAVKTIAIQRVEGAPVVFVREGGKYNARKIETGLANSEWTEIKSGLKSGEEYVSEGSFTVKAELAKSEAEHSH